MYLKSSLNNIFDNIAKVKILRFLILTPDMLTGREISKRLSLSQATCLRALRELEKTNVLTSKQAGRASLFSVNEQSLYFRPLKELFLSEAGFQRELGAFIADQSGVAVDAVLLFGSAARDEDSIDSDIDILIVSDKEPKAIHLEEIVARGFERTGRQISPIWYSRKKLISKKRKREKFVLNLLNDAKSISGSSTGKLLIASK